MNIKKIFKFNKKPKSIVTKKSIEIDPYFYWKNILVVMFGMLFIVSVLCLWIVYALNHEIFVTPESQSKVRELVVVPFKETDLAELVGAFKERSENRTQIINGKTQIQDPSRVSTPAMAAVQNLPE